jgi:hypothetical protein
MEQFGDMNNINLVGTSEPAGMRHLHLTICTVAGNND